MPFKSKAKRDSWRREYEREQWRKRRLELIKKYGGECACCKEKRWEFLTIDHINNDGAKERQRNGKRFSGRGYYHKLHKEARRSDLRVLCYNCNCAIGFYGYCPHKGGKRTIRRSGPVVTKSRQ